MEKQYTKDKNEKLDRSNADMKEQVKNAPIEKDIEKKVEQKTEEIKKKVEIKSTAQTAQSIRKNGVKKKKAPIT